MKKFFLTILAFVYITSSTGINVQMHYCMGKLADWSLGHSNSRACSTCGMEKKNGENNSCCRDSQHFVKNSSDQKTTELSFQFIYTLASAIPLAFEIPPTAFSLRIEKSPVNHAPPLTNGIAVYIRNCTFLI